MPRNERHVVPRLDGGWDVVGPNAARASAHAATQREAIERAGPSSGTAAVVRS
jgi:hypothetical protein